MLKHLLFALVTQISSATSLFSSLYLITYTFPVLSLVLFLYSDNVPTIQAADTKS